MSMQREDFHKLPPIARAEAMDRPYRPSRRPLFYALLVTLAVHLVWGAWALFSRDTRPPPPKVTPGTGIVYTTLQAPVAAPPPPEEKQP